MKRILDHFKTIVVADNGGSDQNRTNQALHGHIEGERQRPA